jgi:hypothetical protein
LKSSPINQGVEGREKESCLQRADQTGRSNRVASFALSRASVSRKWRPLRGLDVLGFDESTRRLMIGETLTHQKLGRPLLYPLNYGAKPLFHWRLLWASAARKMM